LASAAKKKLSGTDKQEVAEITQKMCRTTQQEKNCGIADKYRAIENCPDFAKVI
jgi:tellurite resistance protein